MSLIYYNWEVILKEADENGHLSDNEWRCLTKASAVGQAIAKALDTRSKSCERPDLWRVVSLRMLGVAAPSPEVN